MKHYMAVVPVLAVLAAGCRTQHQVEMTHDVKPIHITIDVNVKVDRALDDFFEDIDEAPPAEKLAADGEEEE